jgi:hypothetical protein
MKFLIGMVLGFGLWFVLWYIVPSWIFDYSSWHYEGDKLVIDSFFGAIGKVVGLFALPIMGGFAVKNSGDF